MRRSVVLMARAQGSEDEFAQSVPANACCNYVRPAPILRSQVAALPI